MSKNETPQILIYLANIYFPVEVIDTERFDSFLIDQML